MIFPYSPAVIPSVLAANATPEVRDEARAMLAAAPEARLYFARGGFKGMNGNYASGILEGMQHFFPQTAGSIQPLA